jgi:hypothetical protein
MSRRLFVAAALVAAASLPCAFAGEDVPHDLEIRVPDCPECQVLAGR